MYNQIILLYTGNYHNTVNRLYFSKTRLKKKISNLLILCLVMQYSLQSVFVIVKNVGRPRENICSL